MEAKILLADSAQASPDGKVHALGLGWSFTGTPTPPAAVILLLSIPWDQSNRRIAFHVELVDADGHTVLDPNGAPMRVEGEIEAGRPAGMPHGSPLASALAMNVGPGISLQVGEAYEYKLTIDGEHKEGWSARFNVRG